MKTKRIVSKLSSLIMLADQEERKAKSAMKMKQFRPKAENAFQEAHDYIALAIRLLEDHRLKLWNASSHAGSAYYAHRRKEE